jgi:hypothetical protein
MPAKRKAIPDSRRSERPPWLEPYGGDPNWRRQMWGEIVALCGRYPAQLRGLQNGWWNDAAHFEHVCALICWRQLLDDCARDPVEELSFQLHIAEFGREVVREPGGVGRASGRLDLTWVLLRLACGTRGRERWLRRRDDD